MDPTAIIIAIAGLACSVGSYMMGQRSVARNDGEKQGVVVAKLDILTKTVDDIKDVIKDNQTDVSQIKDRLSRLESHIETLNSSVTRAHERIDDARRTT